MVGNQSYYYINPMSKERSGGWGGGEQGQEDGSGTGHGFPPTAPNHPAPSISSHSSTQWSVFWCLPSS